MRILDKQNAEEIFHEAKAEKKISKKANYFYIHEHLNVSLLNSKFGVPITQKEAFLKS